MKMRIFGWTVLAALAAALAGCATPPPPAPDIAASPWGQAALGPARAASMRPSWTHYPLPGKAPTRFQYERADGREAIVATAQSAASMLRRSLRVEPADLGGVRFSWKVPELIAQADLARRDRADSPVRVILAFEGDRSRLSDRERATGELVRTLTGEEMPYATLMYVWCNERAPGSVIRSSRSDRIRKLVVESGEGNLNRWMDYERDIRADYRLAFGEEPGALVGIAIMTDSDNTRSTARAWYGPLRLTASAR
jgi:hypothetical protein